MPERDSSGWRVGMTTTFVLAFALMLSACNSGKTANGAAQPDAAEASQAQPAVTAPSDSGPLPSIDANRAFQYTKEITAFGPRPIGSANHKKLEDYIYAHLKGDDVQNDLF